MILGLGLTSCGFQSLQTRMVLAEKFWSEENYQLAVREFEKVYNRDPQGELGIQALIRAATTQYLFLNQPTEARQKLEQFLKDVDVQALGSKQAIAARKVIGDILFLGGHNPEKTVQHYRQLLKEALSITDELEARTRIAESLKALGQFEAAAEEYGLAVVKSPQTAEKTRLLAKQGWCQIFMLESLKQKDKPYAEALVRAKKTFEEAAALLPKDPARSEILFAQGNVLEIQEKYDQALQLYNSILKSYPNPDLVKVKIAGILQRQSKKVQTH